jgi:hypothetical protein
MECDDVRRRLARYLDNDLPAGSLGAMEAHLDHCYLCQEEMNGLISMLDACRDTLRHPDPKPRFEALRPSLKRAQAVPDAPGYRPTHVFRKAAKAVLAAAGIILVASVGLSVVRTARVLVVLAEAGQHTEFVSTQPDRESPKEATNSNPSRSGLFLPLLLAWQTGIQHAEVQAFQLGAANAHGEAEPEAQAAPEKGPEAYQPVSRGDSGPAPTRDARVVTGHEPSRVGLSEKRAVMA